MSVTQADLDRLDQMIASGVLISQYDGKRIEYRTMAELRAARAHIVGLIAAQAGGEPSRSLTPTYGKGL